MSRFIDVGNAYNTLTEYYGHKTDIQHTALADALSQVKTEDAIPLDWINNYINWLNSISTAMAAADVNAIKSMLTKWKLDNGGPVCGPDYCEIGGIHND